MKRLTFFRPALLRCIDSDYSFYLNGNFLQLFHSSFFIIQQRCRSRGTLAPPFHLPPPPPPHIKSVSYTPEYKVCVRASLFHMRKENIWGVQVSPCHAWHLISESSRRERRHSSWTAPEWNEAAKLKNDVPHNQVPSNRLAHGQLLKFSLLSTSNFPFSCRESSHVLHTWSAFHAMQKSTSSI